MKKFSFLLNNFNATIVVPFDPISSHKRTSSQLIFLRIFKRILSKNNYFLSSVSILFFFGQKHLCDRKVPVFNLI
jgi:hypothetical protein